MKVQTFIAPTAKEAIEVVHSSLGPDAMVVNIRKLPKPGWQGLFQSPQVEVSALVNGMASAKPGVESDVERQHHDPISTDVNTPAESNPQVGSRLDIVDDTPIEIPKLSAPAVSDNLFNEPPPKSFVEPLGQAVPEEQNSAGGYWRAASPGRTIVALGQAAFPEIGLVPNGRPSAVHPPLPHRSLEQLGQGS